MKSIFVLVDAFGWTYLKDRSFLPDVLTYRTEVRTVLGFSSGAIPSILTGKLPQEHGHWNLFYYSPETSPFKWTKVFRILPDSMRNNRYLRYAVKVISQKASRFGGYFQIYGVPLELLPFFDICEKDDIYVAGAVPGSVFEELGRRGIKYRAYSYHQGSDRKLLDQAIKDIRSSKDDFYFVYLAELDAFLHHNCHLPEKVDREIKKYESWLKELYSAATSGGEEVAFYVMSDHGMTPKSRGYDLISKVDSLGLTNGKDYIALYDSTMARFWFFTEQARSGILNLKTDAGHFLSMEECRKLGLGFEDNRFGDAIFLMNPGVNIEPSFMGTKAPNGMHGFHPDDEYSSAAFLGNRDPGIPVQTITDFYRVMLSSCDREQERACAGE